MICIRVARLIDTNILVYRADPRDPVKQQIARDLLRAGLADNSLVLPHQAILEFVAAVSRPRPDLAGQPLLPRADALREAEMLTTQFPILYPNAAVQSTALRGCAAYSLAWFDAHLGPMPSASGSARSFPRTSSTAATSAVFASSIRLSRPPARYRNCRRFTKPGHEPWC